MAINELVNVEVVLKGASEAIAGLRGVDEATKLLQQTLAQMQASIDAANASLKGSFAGSESVIAQNIIEPFKRAQDAIDDAVLSNFRLNQSLSSTSTSRQRQEVQELTLQYSDLVLQTNEAVQAAQNLGNIVIGTEEIASFLRQQLIDPLETAKLTIGDVNDAIGVLRVAFNNAETDSARSEVLELTQAYELLRQNIVETATAQSSIGAVAQFESIEGQLRSNLIQPLEQTKLSIDDVNQAIVVLQNAFNAATSDDARQDINLLLSQYAELRQSILDTADTQSAFNQEVEETSTQLQGRLLTALIDDFTRVQLSIDDTNQALRELDSAFNAAQNDAERESLGEIIIAYRELREELQATGAQFQQTSAQLTSGVDETAARLEGQLNAALQGSAISIGQIQQAQRDLTQALRNAVSPDQIRRLAQLSRQYDGLEQQIVEAAEAQDIFNTRLGGFGASGSAGAAALIQLTRGIEDLRFGAAFAINNIEPFITALNRVEKVARATNTSIRDQLVGALLSPAGLLFAFQSVLTAGVLLQPILDELFDEAISDSKAFTEALESAVSNLIEIDRQDFTIRLDADVDSLENNIANIGNAIEETERQISALGENQVRVVGGQLVQQRVLTEQEQERREELENTITALERIEKQLEEELRITGAIAAAREAGIGALEGEVNDAELQRLEDELLATVDELLKEQERAERSLTRLRERLDRELTQARIDNIEDEEQRAIAAARAEFAERIRLAEQVGDADARVEFERGLQVRIEQIRAEFREKEEQESEQALERKRRQEEQLLRQLNQLRASAIEDELEQAIAAEEERFRRATELAIQQENISAAINLQVLLEQRKTQITEDFAERRAQIEIREAEKVANETARIARELERDFEARVAQVARFTDSLVFSITESARNTRSLTDQEIDITRQQLEREEAELNRSLERRLIDQEEYNFQLSQIKADQAQFERRVEEETRGFIERSARGLLDSLIQIGEQELAAFIARQTAAALFAQQAQAAATAATVASQAAIAAAAAPAAAAVSIATFGAAAAAGQAAATASILQITALVRGLQSLSGFKDGGYTGRQSPTSIAGVVHGGEYVFPEPVVRNNIKGFRHLDRILRSGVDLDDLLRELGIPGFQLGGFVPFGAQLEPVDLFRGGDVNSRTSLGANSINATLDRLDRTLTTLSAQNPTVRLEVLESRKIFTASRVSTQIKVPRRLR